MSNCFTVPHKVIWCAHKCTRKAEFSVLGWISGCAMMVGKAPKRLYISIHFITSVLNHISCEITPKAFQSAVLRSQQYQSLLCIGQAVTLTNKSRVAVDSVGFEVQRLLFTLEIIRMWSGVILTVSWQWHCFSSTLGTGWMVLLLVWDLLVVLLFKVTDSYLVHKKIIMLKRSPF